MNRLILVRHGENLANITLEFSHRLIDYSLTPKGVLQAQQTAEYLRDQGIQEIYTSPLKRARETAEIIAAPHNLPVTVVENFREVNVGDLEKQKITPESWNLHNSIIDAWFDGSPGARFPGGENLHELLARVRSGFEQILSGKTGRTILVSAHGGVISFAALGLIPGMEPPPLLLPNCSITELEASVLDGLLELRMVSFGSAAHLSGDAANLALGVPPGSIKGA